MAKQVEGQPVNLRETVEVVGVAAAKGSKQHLTPGKTYKVHPLTAENLIKTGHAKASAAKAK